MRSAYQLFLCAVPHKDFSFLTFLTKKDIHINPDYGRGIWLHSLLCSNALSTLHLSPLAQGAYMYSSHVCADERLAQLHSLTFVQCGIQVTCTLSLKLFWPMCCRDTEALQAFALDAYQCSLAYGPQDVRTSLAYYNLAKVFQGMNEPDKTLICCDQVSVTLCRL